MENSSLVTILQQRASSQPHHRACTFLLDGEQTEAHLTYGQLDGRARAIAGWLQQYELQGQRALLLYPPGLDYIAAFFGCLYAGVVAVPAYPPDPARIERTLPRLRALIDNARPALVMTTTPLVPLGALLNTDALSPQSAQWLGTDAIPDSLALQWRDPAANPGTLAFLQYTSGSTSAPKGVMITHGNLMHNSEAIAHICKHTSHSCVVSWLPPYHDMGLIGTILHPIMSGVPVVLMSPLDFLQRPLRWLQALTHYQATASAGPNFAYDLCVRKSTPEQRALLDLRSWTVAFNGAEPIRAETLDRFATAFAPYGFRREAFVPCYGLAEATLIVSGSATQSAPTVLPLQSAALTRRQVQPAECHGPETQILVGCGPIVGRQCVEIVNPETNLPCDSYEIGEIWITGSSVARGYWNQPEETAAAFQAHLAETGAGPFLRTGDLGFVADGELFVTGRCKDLIVVDGRNHYPQDIELTVEQCHPALRPGCCAAFALQSDGPERLVIAVEVERQRRQAGPDEAFAPNAARSDAIAPEPQEIVTAIRHAIAQMHDLRVGDVALLKAGTIPKTSSGKIQRHACCRGFLAGTLERLEA